MVVEFKGRICRWSAAALLMTARAVAEVRPRAWAVIVAEPAVESRKRRLTGAVGVTRIWENQLLPSRENCRLPEVEVTVTPRASEMKLP